MGRGGVEPPTFRFSGRGGGSVRVPRFVVQHLDDHTELHLFDTAARMTYN